LLGKIGVVCLVVAAATALCASAAVAGKTRNFTGTSFGPEGTTGGSSFNNLQAVAVDPATGNVYVLDTAEGGRLYKFNAAGEPVNFSALSGNVIEGVGGSENPVGVENEIAVAPPGSPGGTAGDIYVANNAFEALSVYGSDGQKLGVLQTSGETCGVAVDSTGHLFVGVFGSTIAEYTPTTNPPTAADLTGTGTAEVGLCNVAVDGLGTVYASNFFGSVTAKLEGLSDSTPTPIEPGGASLATDSSNELYLDRANSIALFTPSGEPDGQFGAGSLAESRGVAISTDTETAYVDNGSTGKVDLYGPVLILPDVTTEPATEVGSESAVLHGTISAAGGPEVSCEFQLTTKSSFEKGGFAAATSVPCSPAGPFTGSGAEAVSAEVTGLATGNVYFFRLVGTNENGSSPPLGSKTGALSFQTLGPSILASGVTDITATAATVTGLINPNGEATTYHVEYGTTESYGSSAPVPDAAVQLPLATGRVDPEHTDRVREVTFSQGRFVAGQEIESEAYPAGTVVLKVEGSPLVAKGTTLTLSAGALGGFEGAQVSLTSPSAAISQRLVGLTPGTLYHFRIVAVNSATAFGPDGTFTTFVKAPEAKGRAYEMVSPAKKIGEVFAPEPLGSLGGTCHIEFCLPGGNNTLMPMQARPDGELLAYGGQPFTAGLSPASNQYLGERTSQGWETSPITPPTAPGITADPSGFKGFSRDLGRGVLLQTRPKLSAEAPGSGQESFSNLYFWERGNPVLRPLVTVEPPNREPNPFEPNAFQLYFSGANAGANGAPAFDHLVFEANDALTGLVPTLAPAAPEVGEGGCGGLPGGQCNIYEWVGGQLRLVNVLPGNETAAIGAAVGSGRRLAESLASRAEPGTQAANVDHAISDDGREIFWSDAAGQVYVRIDGKETVKLNDAGQFLTATPEGSKVLLSDGCLYSMEAEACEATLAGTPAGFLGIMGASENLSRIYFLSTEALAPGAEPRVCEPAESEEEKEGHVPAGFGCNLYAYDNGAITFIATLNEYDNNSGLNNAFGSWKASRSNRTAQVSPDGRFLSFMSFAQLTGQDNRIAGGASTCHTFRKACFEVFDYDLETQALTCVSCNPNGQRPLGPSHLSLIRPIPAGSLPQPENLPANGEGRLFFESDDVLSSTDTNGEVQDVYEWMPSGVGGCERPQGCAALISSGHSPNDSMFLTGTPDAVNAFIVTREQLLAQDEDEMLDVYDARVGGGIGSGGIAPCSGEGCKGPIAPVPGQPGLGSSQFNGPGNQKPHHRKRHHRKRHHKRKHHKKAHHRVRSTSRNLGGAK